MDEVSRRHANVRAALARDGLDAALVCGSEYSGFEGAVTYVSGFTIVHRYAYVLIPVEGEPTIVFPTEADDAAVEVVDLRRTVRFDVLEHRRLVVVGDLRLGCVVDQFLWIGIE